MGIAYECDERAGITVTVWDSTVTPDDWRALVRGQDADPKWPTGPAFLGVLTTARGFSTFDESVVAEMREFYANRPKRLAKIRSATVADRGIETVGTLEQVVGKLGVRNIVFTDVRTACTWLGVDVEVVEAIVARLRSELRAEREPR